ncbi:MAG: DNA primase [Parcubacteria group bacterium]
MATFVGTSSTEEIKSKVDIIDLIQEYVQLRQAGTNWKANCPFHSEKTPSFMASREKQIWHCFGCGEGGDIFSFVQKIEGLEFPEALRLLAKKAGVQLPTFNPELQTKKTQMLDVVKAASQFFSAKLHEPLQGKIAREYLQTRGVSDETIDDFGIGYAPDAWDQLNTYLIQNKIFVQDIFQAGLTIKRERGDGYYDRFRNRLIFPLRDVHGTVIGFGGRVLAADDQGAKYINSPQTLVYDKSGYLFGLDSAKHEIRNAKLAVIVEGYMDVVASHQAGVTNVVASSGTALTDRQVRLLKRFTDIVALAFDADLAGEDASRRGIDVALRGGLEVRIITLPHGKDPDECIKEDLDAWKKAIASAQGIMEYTFARAVQGKDMSTLAHKKEVTRTVLQALTRIPDPIEQTHYLQKLAALVRVEESILRDKLASLQKTQGSTFRPAQQQPISERPEKDRYQSLIERLMAFFVFRPDLAVEVTSSAAEEMIPEGRMRDLYKQLLISYTSQHNNTAETVVSLLSSKYPGLKEFVAVLLMKAEHEFSSLGEDDFIRDLQQTIAEVRLQYYTRELTKVAEQMSEAEAKGDEGAMTRLSTRHSELSEKLAHLQE